MRTLPHQVISLIHYVELNNSGWWEKTVDRCVMGVLWLSKAPIEINKICKETFAQLDLNLKATEIRRSLGRLISEEKVIDLKDGRYKLSIDCEAFLSKKVEDSKQLEAKVKEKFLQQVNAVFPIRKRKIWESFIEKFLVSLITDSGARIYEFFFC